MNEILLTTIEVFVGLILLVLIIRHPELGVTFTLASLPIVDLLPSIPLFSSVVPVMGGVTLVVFLFRLKKEKMTFHSGRCRCLFWEFCSSHG